MQKYRFPSNIYKLLFYHLVIKYGFHFKKKFSHTHKTLQTKSTFHTFVNLNQSLKHNRSSEHMYILVLTVPKRSICVRLNVEGSHSPPLQHVPSPPPPPGRNMTCGGKLSQLRFPSELNMCRESHHVGGSI